MASQQPAGRFDESTAPSSTVTLVNPSRCVYSRSAASCAVPMSVAYTRPERPDHLGEAHGPRAEAGADVRNRHAGFEFEQLDELGHLRLGRFDLPFGQPRLLGRHRDEQPRHGRENR